MSPESGARGADKPPAGLNVIPVRLLEHVRGLNRAYLELLSTAAQASPAHAATSGLAPEVIAQVVALDEAARERAAACSFALFGLGLADTDFWLGAGVARIADLPQERYGRTPADRFLAAALFFAWHVAQSSELAARLLLAMPARTHYAMRRLSPAHLTALAVMHPELLTARWAQNPCFWPDLLAFAASGDQPALDAARLLGIQLIAGEIEPGVIRRVPHGGTTAMRRPRL